MKFDNKNIPLLTGKDNFIRWRECVVMAIKASGKSYLLSKITTNPTNRISNNNNVNITTNATGGSSSSSSSSAPAPSLNTSINTSTSADTYSLNASQISNIPTSKSASFMDIEMKDWVNDNEIITSSLYFTVTPAYHPVVAKHSVVMDLLEELSGLFVIHDPMAKFNLRTQLDKLRISWKSDILEQFVAFDQLVQKYVEAGGTLTDDDKYYIIVNSLPQKQKELVSNMMTLGLINNLTSLKDQLKVVQTREITWMDSSERKANPLTNPPTSTQDTALPAIIKDSKKRGR